MARTEIAPAYQCYVSDQLADAVGLTLEQVGAYQLLAWQAWREGGLPDDHAELAKRVGLTARRFGKIAPAILRCFTSRNGRLVLEWQEAQRVKQKAWREKSREGGLKSAERRKAGVKGSSTVVEPEGNFALCSLPSVSANTPSTPPANGKGGGPDSQELKAEAIYLLARLRDQRIEHRTPTSGSRYSIPPGVVADLSLRAQKALSAIGGAHAIAQADDAGLRVLRSQFQTAYVGAEG